MTCSLFKVNELLLNIYILLSYCFVIHLSVEVTVDNWKKLFQIIDLPHHRYVSINKNIDKFSDDVFNNPREGAFEIEIRNCQKLLTLPENLFQRLSFVKLDVVSIYKNGITHLPEKLFLVKHGIISKLRLDENNLQTLPPQIFQALSNLRYVNLTGNKLTHISPDLFKNNIYLEYVDLQNNRLKSLPKQLRLSNIRGNVLIVYLDRNRLTNIEADTFSQIDMTSVHFKFSFNNLVCLPDMFLDYTPLPALIKSHWLQGNCLDESSQICQKFDCKSRPEKQCEKLVTSSIDMKKCPIRNNTIRNNTKDENPKDDIKQDKITVGLIIHMLLPGLVTITLIILVVFAIKRGWISTLMEKLIKPEDIFP